MFCSLGGQSLKKRACDLRAYRRIELGKESLAGDLHMPLRSLEVQMAPTMSRRDGLAVEIWSPAELLVIIVIFMVLYCNSRPHTPSPVKHNV